MSNLRAFLNGIAEGVAEQAETLEDESTDSEPVALTLRDYFSQLNAVAEHTASDDRIDWAALEDRVHIDISLNPRAGLDEFAHAVTAAHRALADAEQDWLNEGGRPAPGEEGYREAVRLRANLGHAIRSMAQYFGEEPY